MTYTAFAETLNHAQSINQSSLPIVLCESPLSLQKLSDSGGASLVIL